MTELKSKIYELKKKIRLRQTFIERIDIFLEIYKDGNIFNFV